MNATDPSSQEDINIAVGSTYIIMGVLFIPLHLITAYLIHSDKDMQNPTYHLMVSLSITDALALVPVAVYSGLILSLGVHHYLLDRCMPFLISFGWYVSCTLLVAVAFSRWVAVTRSHMTEQIFTRKVMLCIQIAPWVIVAAWRFYPDVIYQVAHFIPQYYTWAYDVTTQLGTVLHWANFGIATCCSVVEASFNTLSLYCVRKTMNEISPVMASSGNQRREILLLFQCAIVGLIFVLAEIMYTITMITGTKMSCLIMHYVWILNHCLKPLVYLAMNRRLSGRFLTFITAGRYSSGTTTTMYPQVQRPLTR